MKLQIESAKKLHTDLMPLIEDTVKKLTQDLGNSLPAEFQIKPVGSVVDGTRTDLFSKPTVDL